MYLQPIEKPKHWLARIAYRLTRRQMGKVISPMRVAYARVPESLWLMSAIQRFTTSGVQLDPALGLLVQTHVARLNHCAFCIDIGEMFAERLGEPLDKFREVGDYASDPRFTERERAALAYVEEVTVSRTMSRGTFERLREHFTEREIVEITMLNAVEHFYNVTNISLGIESDGLCAMPAVPPGLREAG